MSDCIMDKSLEFGSVEWAEYRVTDHDGEALLILKQELNRFRDIDAGDEWAVPTGLYKVALSGRLLTGNRAYCFTEIERYLRDNPAGLGEDTRAIIREFLTSQGREDGRKGIPEENQGD